MSRLAIQDDKKGEIELVSKLSDDLASLLFSESYSDVIFIIGDERISCNVSFQSDSSKGKNYAQN